MSEQTSGNPTPDANYQATEDETGPEEFAPAPTPTHLRVVLHALKLRDDGNFYADVPVLPQGQFSGFVVHRDEAYAVTMEPLFGAEED